ncbi:Ger(x)C family spore germination protein [Paenibacillus puerhi]|uniref:Ger(x)C family spore germination protein n=1 Tax=Paenibacillus puerhi TaxID=2692622 RepID=UPI00135A3552|nr:Ger(x)C family spore germination protein [Paenibacillus puerhi]
MAAIGRTLFLGLLAISMPLVTTGCWSKTEINDLLFVSGLYIDKGGKPGEVEVTISAPLPNRLSMQHPNAGGGGRPFGTVTKKGSSIPDALEHIQTDLTRKISWGHTRIVVFGKEYAEQGIDHALDWMSREPLFHLSSYLLLFNGKAKEATRLTPVFETTPHEVLREFSSRGNLLSTQLVDLLKARSVQQGAAISLINLQKTRMPSEGGGLEEWAGHIGAGIFRSTKMVGTTTVEEAKALAWAQNQLTNTRVTVRSGEKEASAFLFNLKSQIKVTQRDGKPHFLIKLTGGGELISSSPKTEVKEVEHVDEITSLINRHYTTALTSALNKGKQKGADLLQLGYRLEWAKPKEWEKWRKDWPAYVKEQLRFEVSSEIDMEYFGSQTGS